MQGIMLLSFTSHAAGLVSWVSAQEPSFSFRKSICIADRCVIQNLSQIFLAGKNKGGKNKDCVQEVCT